MVKRYNFLVQQLTDDEWKASSEEAKEGQWVRYADIEGAVILTGADLEAFRYCVEMLRHNWGPKNMCPTLALAERILGLSQDENVEDIARHLISNDFKVKLNGVEIGSLKKLDQGEGCAECGGRKVIPRCFPNCLPHCRIHGGGLRPCPSCSPKDEVLKPKEGGWLKEAFDKAKKNESELPKWMRSQDEQGCGCGDNRGVRKENPCGKFKPWSKEDVYHCIKCGHRRDCCLAKGGE